jgi:hypothetical protein
MQGIATKANLQMITDNDYDYVRVQIARIKKNIQLHRMLRR